MSESAPTSVFYLAKHNLLTLTAVADAENGAGIIVQKQCKKKLNFFFPFSTYWKSLNPMVKDMLIFNDSNSNANIKYYYPEDGVLYVLNSNQPKTCYFPVLTIGDVKKKRAVTNKNKFLLLSASPNKDLAKLMAYDEVRRHRYYFWNYQIAVWIITENPNLNELKNCINAQNNLTNTHEITDKDYRDYSMYLYDVIWALKIIKDSGLDLKKYTIWKDRNILFWSLMQSSWSDPEEILKIIPDKEEYGWKTLKTEMSDKLASIEPQILQNLKSKYFKVKIKAPEQSHIAAWLAWYFRDLGYWVRSKHLKESTNTQITFESNETRKAGKAVSVILQKAFKLKVIQESEKGILLQGGSLNIIIYPQFSPHWFE